MTRRSEPEMPEQILVGAYHYTVSLDQAAVDAASRAGHINLCGSTDHVAQTMAVAPELGPDARAETLLHECVHAIFNQHPTDLRENIEERLVMILGYALLDLLRRNPQLVAYVTAVEP